MSSRQTLVTEEGASYQRGTEKDAVGASRHIREKDAVVVDSWDAVEGEMEPPQARLVVRKGRSE